MNQAQKSNVGLDNRFTLAGSKMKPMDLHGTRTRLFLESSKDTSEFITSWADLYATNYPTEQGRACGTLSITEGYPHLA